MFYCLFKSMESLEVNKVLSFLKLVHNLKHNARRGWEHYGIKNPESIASHMYNMALMTFLIENDSKLNRFRCMQLALIHDLAECIVGDITPADNVPVDVKHKLEDSAMKELSSNLGNNIGSMIYELYKEYENNETNEAKFVKDLDRFDMIFTASEYEVKQNKHGELQEFFDSTAGKFQHPFIEKLVTTLEKERQENINKV